MIRSITRQKPIEEIERLLAGMDRIFVVGCGTCTTLTRTGGAPEVDRMNNTLAEKGKVVTGSTVVPVACDNLSPHILDDQGTHIRQADALLVMSCAFGVQTIANQLGKMVIPAQETLFVGKETAIGRYNEICIQCGNCIIGETGGVCPVTACHKSMVNGPCGGTNKGRCEIDSNKDCAWTLIYNRLRELGRLDDMRRYQRPRNHQAEPKPGKYTFSD